MSKTIKIFEDIRNWGKMRGIERAEPQVQMQRVFQEIVEIHEALVNDDDKEFIDAIGDSIVTLIMLAGTKNHNAEDCLEDAFNVIKLRKGLNKNGSFVRYAKLSKEDQKLCDKQQGNPGNEYFLSVRLEALRPNDFKGKE